MHKGLNWDALQVISGSIAFFIFKQQTSASAFVEGLHGRGHCVDTDPEPSPKRHPFLTLYARFSRTHFYFGYTLVLLCSLLAILDVPGYALATFGAWIVALSLLFAPFWFNPRQFTLQQTKEDYHHFQKWLRGEFVDPESKQTWSTWHNQWMREKIKAANDFDPDVENEHIWQKAGQKLIVWMYKRILKGEEEDGPEGDEGETMEQGDGPEGDEGVTMEEGNTAGDVSSVRTSSIRINQSVCRERTLFSKESSIFFAAC